MWQCPFDESYFKQFQLEILDQSQMSAHLRRDPLQRIAEHCQRVTQSILTFAFLSRQCSAIWDEEPDAVGSYDWAQYTGLTLTSKLQRYVHSM